MFTKRGGKGSVAQYLRRTSLDNILGPALAPVSQWLRAFQRSQLMAERERESSGRSPSEVAGD